jgi:hypothetical protein
MANICLDIGPHQDIMETVASGEPKGCAADTSGFFHGLPDILVERGPIIFGGARGGQAGQEAGG